MRLVVDANIIYSVILKTDGVVADVFFNTRPLPEFCAPVLLKKELVRHRPRMAKQMKKSVAEITQIQEILLGRLTFIDDALIDDHAWKNAHRLVKDVDPDDEDFVALAIHLGCPFWTGDMKLHRSLKGTIVQVVITSEVRILSAE